MSVKIVEVKNKAQMKAFVRFYDDLYKNTWQYVPPLHSGEIKFYDKEKNKSHSYCESTCFLAYKDNKVVGRIGGIINKRYNEKVGKKQVRFTTFDFIDDYEVSKALIDAVGKWASDKGMEEFDGPIGFTDFDRQGMLTEGYDVKGMYITNYNFDYYPRHMEKLGFETDVEWNEFVINTPKEVDPRITRIAERVNKMGYHVVKFKNMKHFKSCVYEAFDVYNAAFQKLHGVVPITDAQVRMYVGDYINLVKRDYAIILRDKNEKIVAFALLVGSLYEAGRKAKGRLFPFGWYHIIKAFKHPKVLDMYWIAVEPNLQGFGIPAIIMKEVITKMIRDGVQCAETGPELVDNHEINTLWNRFDKKMVRKRKCYQRKIKED